MRILVVSPFDPGLPSGAPRRLAGLARALSRRHDITVVHPARDGAEPLPASDSGWRRVPVPVPDFAASLSIPRTRIGHLWAIFSSRYTVPAQRWMRALSPLEHTLRRFAHDAFDAVWCHRAVIAELLYRLGHRRVVVDVDDLERDDVRLKSHHALLPLEVLKATLSDRALAHRFPALAVCKEDDRRFFGGAPHVFVVPNGATPVETATPPEEETDGEILFLGGLGWRPNVDAVSWFARTCLPRVRSIVLNARLTVVGSFPGSELRALGALPGCRVVGQVADVRESYASASIVVLPLLRGGGTSVRLPEALMHGKAVVASPVGARGSDLIPGVHFELAAIGPAFAEACTRLLLDPDRRRRMGAAGRARTLERHTWEASARAAEDALVAAVARSRRGFTDRNTPARGVD